MMGLRYATSEATLELNGVGGVQTVRPLTMQ